MKKLFIFLSIISTAVLYSCNQSNDSSKSESFLTTTDQAPSGEAYTDSAKIVKTAGLQFKIADVETGIKSVSALTSKFGGRISYTSFNSQPGGSNELRISDDSLMVVTTYSPQADITVRVPSESLEEYLFSLAELGYHTNNSSLQIDDKSLVYLENLLKQKNREEVLKENKSTVSKTTTALEKINVKDNMINQQIANRSIDMDVKYSAVNINLYQSSEVKKEIIANYHISEYKLPFATRLGDSLQGGWEAFLGLVLVVANLWAFIVFGIVCVFGYRFLKQREYFKV